MFSKKIRDQFIEFLRFLLHWKVAHTVYDRQLRAFHMRHHHIGPRVAVPFPCCDSPALRWRVGGLNHQRWRCHVAQNLFHMQRIKGEQVGDDRFAQRFWESCSAPR